MNLQQNLAPATKRAYALDRAYFQRLTGQSQEAIAFAEALLEHASEPCLLILDGSLSILWIANCLDGWQASQLLGQSIERVVADKREQAYMLLALRKVLLSGEARQPSFWHISPSGRLDLIQCRMEQMTFADGRLGVIVACSASGHGSTDGDGKLKARAARLSQSLAQFELGKAKLEARYDAVARELRELKALVRRQDRELADARDMQLAMLPKLSDVAPEYFDLAARMETCAEVGGDYYDFLPGCYDEEDRSMKCWIALGDATGHGVRAGIMVTALKSNLHALCHPSYSPSKMLEVLSERLAAMGLRRMYMGLHLAHIACLPDGDGCYAAVIASAGMPVYFILRAATGQVETVNTKAMYLGTGVRLPKPYKEYRFTFCKGDMLILISDGYSESRNAAGDMMPESLLATAIQAAHAGGSEAVVQAVADACKAFRQQEVPEDDSTILVLRCK